MDPCFAPAADVADAVRRGERSPVEVVDAFLARIADRNPTVNAYVTVAEDGAREAARRAETAVDAGDNLGPLHGVPVALKDLAAFKAGVRHTFGCRAFADHVADHTSAFVERLEDAGAVVLGKTNTPEFGHRPTTDNLLVGPTSTPFDPGMNAGGSSGGSAAAVADGMAAVAQGGDAAGSIRIPAALCGVYGLKPSFGRIPSPTRPNAFRNQAPFVDKGPLARTVRDAALMLDAMAGPHPRDPFSLPDDGADYLAAVDRSVDDLRVAYSPDLGAFPVAKSVRSVVGDAVDDLAAAGAGVDEVEVDLGRPLDELREGGRKPLAYALAAKVHASLADRHGVDFLGADREDVPDELADRIRGGEALTAVDAERANAVRTAVFDGVQDVFEAYDLLVTPTVSVPAVPNGVVGPTEVDDVEMDPTTDWLLTWPFNFTGHPAASVPAGLTDDGYPVGMQVVGRRFADCDVLAVSAAVERERPWRHAYPGRG